MSHVYFIYLYFYYRTFEETKAGGITQCHKAAEVVKVTG